MKTTEDEEQLIEMRKAKMEDFEKYQESFEKDMSIFLADQQEQHHLLNLFFDSKIYFALQKNYFYHFIADCQYESELLMKKAYEVRTKVIEDIIEEYEKMSPPPKEKKGSKKDKKDKKKKK